MKRSRTGRYFLSLLTGERIHRTWWQVIPITDNAIQRMNILGLEDKQPLLRDMLIETSPGNNIDEDAYDQDYEPTENDEEDIPFTLADYDDVSDNNDDSEGEESHSTDGYIDEIDGEQNNPNGNNTDIIEDAPDTTLDAHENATQPVPATNVVEVNNTMSEGLEDNNEVVDSHIQNTTTDATEVEVEPQGEGAYAGRLRPRNEVHAAPRLAEEMDQPANSKSYTTGFQALQYVANPPKDPTPESFERIQAKVFGFNFHQMSATVGIKKHGDEARKALPKEAMQLMDEDVFQPFDARDMPNDQRLQMLKRALRAVNLIKKKRNGILKGRTCTDGRPQKRSTQKGSARHQRWQRKR